MFSESCVFDAVSIVFVRTEALSAKEKLSFQTKTDTFRRGWSLYLDYFDACFSFFFFSFVQEYHFHYKPGNVSEPPPIVGKILLLCFHNLVKSGNVCH